MIRARGKCQIRWRMRTMEMKCDKGEEKRKMRIIRIIRKGMKDDEEERRMIKV